MKISCDIIGDMLPLYVDECCSEDTKRLLEEHFSECESCKEKLEKLKQPIFIQQEPEMNEKIYKKHAKRAFGKVRRRMVISILIILALIAPLIWLGVNEAKGEGVSYSNLKYVLKGNALLRAIKNGDYEKAFSYLDLRELYEWETEYEEVHLDDMYQRAEIGGQAFYLENEVYNDVYLRYLEDGDEQLFWKSVYFQGEYMIPVLMAEEYLRNDEEIKWYNFRLYKVSGQEFYVNGERYPEEWAERGEIRDLYMSVCRIMPEEYYLPVREDHEEVTKKTTEAFQELRDMGYEGYVARYKERWMQKFEQLEADGITVAGYKLLWVDGRRSDGGYEWEYRLEVNVNGRINKDYGISFLGKKRGFYPLGGSFSGDSMEEDRIPITQAFR